MMCILAGVLDGESLQKPFLIDLLDIKAANNKNLQQAVTSSLFKVLGSNMDYDLVLLFLTDGASYCLKAGAGLKNLFPKMIHLTCLCHGLNRVAKMVRREFPLVDQLISEVKKFFVKAPQCRQHR